MAARKGQIADPDSVRVDQWGAVCGKCHEMLYLAAIKNSQPVYRHLSTTSWRPGCRA